MPRADRRGRHLDAGLLPDVLDLHVATGEARPGEIVEEEVRTGVVGLAGPPEVVDLYVVEAGDLAQEAQSLARLPQLLQLSLCRLQTLGGDRLKVVDLAGDQANRLAVSRELCCLPRLADTREAGLDIAHRWVEQALERLLRGTGNLKVARDVVHEEVLEDVGVGVAPSPLAGLLHPLDEPRVVARPLILRKEMLVRVDKGERADLNCEVGLRLH